MALKRVSSMRAHGHRREPSIPHPASCDVERSRTHIKRPPLLIQQHPTRVGAQRRAEGKQHQVDERQAERDQPRPMAVAAERGAQPQVQHAPQATPAPPARPSVTAVRPGREIRCRPNRAVVARNHQRAGESSAPQASPTRAKIAPQARYSRPRKSAWRFTPGTPTRVGCASGWSCHRDANFDARPRAARGRNAEGEARAVGDAGGNRHSQRLTMKGVTGCRGSPRRRRPRLRRARRSRGTSSAPALRAARRRRRRPDGATA